MPGPKAIHIIRPSSNNTARTGSAGGIAFIPEPIRKKKPNINLFDPSKQPPPLKRPTLFKPIIEKKQVLLSEKALYLHNKQLQNLSILSESDTSDDSSHEDDEDARTNRKMADLEISNQSLLIVNQMLETTVKNQAKQVASFKQIMTLPIDGENRQESDSLQLNEEDWQIDEQFNRLRRMTEYMIEQAQKALEYQVETSARVVIPGLQQGRSSNGRRLHRHRSDRSQSSASVNSTPNQHPN